jgi:hypothetical protein
MPTLTSTGNVNLTTSTNWSPAQIPQAGDDLVIATGHTLTADIDFVANTITTNGATSKITISGTPRTLTATNGWFSRSTFLFNGISNATVNIFGRFTQVASQGIFNSISNSTVKLSTVGEIQSNELVVTTSSSHLVLIGSSDSLSTLTTIGLFNCLINNGGSLTAIFSNTNPGSWNHYSIGTNIFRNIFNLKNFSNTSDINLNINGNFSYERTDTTTNTFVFWFLTGLNKSIVFNGNHTFEDISTSGLTILATTNTFTGTVEINGKFCVKNFAGSSMSIQGTNVLFLHRNQSYTIASDESVNFSLAANVSANFTNTQIQVSGNLSFSPALATTLLVDSSTLFSLTTTGLAIANIKIPTLRNKIVKLSSVVPVLPNRQNVTAGISYGFSGSELVGTALQLDPAILAAAISANIPDIIDGVHDADLRDYEDTNHSLAWTLKKLRQANPTIEFEVTDDITPEVGRFSVNLTGYTNDSFSHTVLYMDAESNLPYDDSPIISYTQEDEYGIIEIEEPFSEPPEVGSVGFINPAIHVHSIEAIQSGLAKEDTLTTGITNILDGIAEIPTSLDQETIDAIRDGLAEQETLETGITFILEGIGEINVDFTPILDRLPDELENGRMKAVLSTTQVSSIVTQLKRYEVS